VTGRSFDGGKAVANNTAAHVLDPARAVDLTQESRLKAYPSRIAARMAGCFRGLRLPLHADDKRFAVAPLSGGSHEFT
jgi:hypothetical protein